MKNVRFLMIILCLVLCVMILPEGAAASSADDWNGLLEPAFSSGTPEEEEEEEATWKPAVEGLSITAPQIMIKSSEILVGKGKTVTIPKRLTNVEKTKKTKYQWTSDDTSVVKVSKDGKVTGVKEGTANVSVVATTLAGDILNASFTVTVIPAVQKLSMKEKKLTLKEQQYYQAMDLVSVTPADTDKSLLLWKSSTKSVLAVDKDGVLYARRIGTSKVTVTANDGSKKSATISVTVEPATTLYVDKATINADMTKVTFTLKNYSKKKKIADADIHVIFCAASGNEIHKIDTTLKKVPKFKTLKGSGKIDMSVTYDQPLYMVGVDHVELRISSVTFSDKTVETPENEYLYTYHVDE